MEKLIFIDKPAGMTSHDVVDRVRKELRIRQVGHAGTLDPFATGLLIIGIGDATKRLGELSGLPKTYEATATLGATSTTFDLEGEITEMVGASLAGAQNRAGTRPAPTRNDIEEVFNRFRGGYAQKAPIYSAKKIGGKKLYELARKGEAREEDRPTKNVTITELEIISYEWPTLAFRVSCGSGTYIRSLADDIGRELGCGAYLTALRRTSIGDISVQDAVTLDNLFRA